MEFKNYEAYTLKNGLRIVHKQTLGEVSYCGFIVNAGTRDENHDEFGMAHFVEHMLFKGTSKRRSSHIINRMESVGGELNAYTNKEETVIYSVFLEQHLERALEILSDLTFNSQFPQSEINKEVDVILDEINSYEDCPSDLIFDEFDNLVFKDSQLGHNILGDVDSLKTFDTNKARLFVNRFYNPENVVFFSLGKTDFRKISKLAGKYLLDVPIYCSGVSSRLEPFNNSACAYSLNKDTSQSHVVIGSRAYNLFDSNRTALLLLTNILGGPGMNSRLNISLREKRGYVYNVEASVVNYTDSGLFSIYFGSDQANTNKCVSLIHRELKKMRDIKLSSSQLAAAKKQLIGQIGVATDNRENLALSLGKSFLHHNHYNSLEEIFRKIGNISSIDLLDVANQIFEEKRLFSLVYN